MNETTNPKRRTVFLFALPVLPMAKLQLAIVSLGALVVAQDTPQWQPVPQWLDLGVTFAAIGLLGYILKLVFSGGLVSKELVEQIVEKAVRETLEEVNK